MVRSSFAIAVTLTSFVAGPLAARQAPDFSGAWVLASSQSGNPGARAGGGGMGGGGGMSGGARAAGGGGSITPAAGNAQPPEFVITQTARTLTIERTAPSPAKWVYNLDGSESVNTIGRQSVRAEYRRDY